jgi:hypothetical protein
MESALAPVKQELKDLRLEMQLVRQQQADKLQQQDRRISVLERELAKTKYQLRQVGLQERALNIAIFPKADFREEFGAAQLQHFATPLGLTSTNDLTLVLARPGVKVIRCKTPALRAAIMKAANRQKAATDFHILLHDDLSRDEQAERLQLKPVMQHLHAKGFRAFWDRSSIVWRGHDGNRCSMEPWEIQLAPDAAALIQLADERSGDTPVQDAAPLNHEHGGPAMDAAANSAGAERADATRAHAPTPAAVAAATPGNGAQPVRTPPPAGTTQRTTRSSSQRATPTSSAPSAARGRPPASRTSGSAAPAAAQPATDPFARFASAH